MNGDAIVTKRFVHAPVTEVYRAFTRSIVLREWMCDGATCLARPGGHLHCWWNGGYYASGEFVSLEENHQVNFTWHGRNEPGPTRIQVTFAPIAEGVEVVLTHSGMGLGTEWATAREESRRGWEAGFENLQSVLETGYDLRFTRRPMLGINLGEFDAGVAARLKVPASQGVRLTGVVEGLGAQLAGLLPDDVIVSIGGAATIDWPTLVATLQGHRAGETVEVVFYRGDTKQAVPMTLSARPLPEIPSTSALLADAIRRSSAECHAQLFACFEGVSDAEAAHHPAPGEWSALETVGHLIAGDRDNLAWIGDLINDDERWPDRFENPTAVDARVKATAAAYPTVAAMLNAWQCIQVELAAMLAALPAEFVGHKSSYWRLCRDLLQGNGEHVGEHAGQIRAAVQAARG